MHIGLYGMPTAGKTHILRQIGFMDTIEGSELLRKYDPLFDIRDSTGRTSTRKKLAQFLMNKNSFIMDGHFAFGDEIAFTEDDGRLYDTIVYLYISPKALRDRMSASEKNRKYLRYDITEWQQKEIVALRTFCHEHNKDFYVIDNPPLNYFGDISLIIRFIREIANGYSCLSFAQKCVDAILQKSRKNTVLLLDGDKTLTLDDSSNAVFGYKTNLYDGNFYTGYQTWKQNEEFKQYTFSDLSEIPVRLNEKLVSVLNEDAFILTSGHEKIWEFISSKLGVTFFCGPQMAAETKFFIVKFLQHAGKYVIAYGDGMNDYFMLKQANVGYLVTKSDGSVSNSLNRKNLEGLILV